ncbi:hypothetical protein RFI_27753 [Reticulomyxa filosa]|uniref:Uncharacterized protein n=1 Tax=Reticulomyxa filosa TaxID=46433 RepID=X6M6T1_RETFI|nr:hypothetical protein RFI_27753 [Reticulomyxa filosa]|eukprot:ETO09624.1 hypothetical protein RFI_27753 [Reticulomyxa filosa]
MKAQNLWNNRIRFVYWSLSPPAASKTKKMKKTTHLFARSKLIKYRILSHIKKKNNKQKQTSKKKRYEFVCEKKEKIYLSALKSNGKKKNKQINKRRVTAFWNENWSLEYCRDVVGSEFIGGIVSDKWTIVQW